MHDTLTEKILPHCLRFGYSHPRLTKKNMQQEADFAEKTTENTLHKNVLIFWLFSSTAGMRRKRSAMVVRCKWLGVAGTTRYGPLLWKRTKCLVL